MLPEGFCFKPRHLAPLDLDLLLDGQVVAQLMQRLGGSWCVFLDRYEPVGVPLKSRPCRSRETGIAGLEAWARRHEARLRREVAKRRAMQ